MLKNKYDVIVIGAGAAGLMASWQAAKRGKSVLLLEKESKVGKKIRISGGGRCNFTNLYCSHENYLSSNPHFCKSALKQYTQYDFIDLVESNHIEFYEKTLGQLFCRNSAQEIIDMMLALCEDEGVNILLNTTVTNINFQEKFNVKFKQEVISSDALIITSGALSIPKIGATDFAYRIAKQFGHNIIDTRPALVPLCFPNSYKHELAQLSGVSFEARVSTNDISFTEKVLLTHHGFSGPAILQISSYLNESDFYYIDILPNLSVVELEELLYENRNKLKKFLSLYIPKRFAEFILSSKQFDFESNTKVLADRLKNWELEFNGTTGYNKAEVTIGGIDVDEISSKTMESMKQKGLYFAGEALDVTGHLGGFNFQWAWSSAYVAGNNV